MVDAKAPRPTRSSVWRKPEKEVKDWLDPAGGATAKVKAAK